jgi:hypothetical protein
MRTRLAHVCLAALLAALPATKARAGACPSSSLDLGARHIDTGAPSYSVPDTTWDGIVLSDGYDLVAGTISAYTPGGLYRVYVRPHDLYDVTGVAPGTHGASGCWGVLETTIVTPADSIDEFHGQNIFSAATRANDFTTGATIEFVAGTPTPVAFLLQAFQSPGGAHESYGLAKIRFTGLPPGALVTSCQGYVDPATPALPTSWGRVKAAYR